MNMRCAQDTALVGQVACGAGVFDERAAETQVLRGAHRGADARVTHEAADDQVEGAEVLQAFGQFGTVERARQQFADDGFVALWLKARNEFTTDTLRVEHATERAEVAHMHDRPAGGTGRGE
ncbi:hypothetical protein D3C86_1669950 [compost metagenome]